MPLGQLPPWLQISPRDYLLATQSGAQLGNTIAEQTQKAWEEQQRLRMEAQTQQNVAEQHAVENAMTRLAADRLEQYRQSEAAHRNQELGIQQQGLGLHGQELDIQRQGLKMRGERESDLQDAREQRIKDNEQRLKDQQTQTSFLNDMKQREMDRREKEAERVRGTSHFFTGPDNKQYVVQPGSTNAIPVGMPQPPESTGGSNSLLDLWKGSMRLGGKLSGLSNFLPESAPTPSPQAATQGALTNLPPTQPMLVSGSKNEVTRTTKDGRKAVFDADTKEFLRYAD